MYHLLEVRNVSYLATWIEGAEVFYRFVNEKELQELLEPDKNFIVIKIS